MSLNSEVHVDRKLLDKLGTVNNPLAPSKCARFDNAFYLRVDFVNPLCNAQAGLYEKTIRLPAPIMSWHRASKGTTDKFAGCLAEAFPELKNLSEKELRDMEKTRDRV